MGAGWQEQGEASSGVAEFVAIGRQLGHAVQAGPPGWEYANIPVNVSFLQELLDTVAEQGRQLLPRSLGGSGPRTTCTELAAALVSGRGEASGVAIAREILARYRALDARGAPRFLTFLASTCSPTARRWRARRPGLSRKPRAPRRSRRCSGRSKARARNSSAASTWRRAPRPQIVAMRRDLLGVGDPALAPVDRDLMHLLASWFNRGFLVLRRIDWQTPAAILEKIIAYEAVHEIQGWDDLRRRLDPADRRCFAFFHPSLVDEPLIFVEVALMRDMPDDIQRGAAGGAARTARPCETPTTAVFYSISNCQEGLRGISFGNFLIKQVVEDLVKERPSLKTFVTLSPVPQFRRLARGAAGRSDDETLVDAVERERSRLLDEPDWIDASEQSPRRSKPLLMRARRALLPRRQEPRWPPGRSGRPLPSRQRRAARAHQLAWAIPRPKGLREAHGLMVNYRYELKDIERNHEAYANEGMVAASRQVHGLLKPERGRAEPQPVPAAAGCGRRYSRTRQTTE